MNDSQEQHLQDIKTALIQWVDLKYRAGAKEHDGDLMEMSADEMHDNAIEEALDLFVYLVSEKMKRKQTVNTCK